MNAFVTEDYLATNLWLPFGTAQITLAPGACQPLCVFQLLPGQLAKLSLLTLHYVRYLGASLPVKLNPALAAVYLGLYGSEGYVVQVIPGQPLTYVGLDIPGVTQTSPWLAPEIGEADTYTILLVNNMTNANAKVVAGGAWRLTTS